MKRDYKLYLNDIKESIGQIEKYVERISEDVFKKDKLLQDAVIKKSLYVCLDFWMLKMHSSASCILT